MGAAASPEADVQLEEAVEVMRELWTGRQVSHRGRHYTVENARIFTLPDEPPPVYVSAFGPKAVQLAGRIADGYCHVAPEAEMVQAFRDAGGAGKPTQGGTKVCWGSDRAACRKTAHRLWPNESLPGELAMILPTPAHFEQATELVTEEMVAESIACGEDVDEQVAQLQAYKDAGFDGVYVHQIGADHEAFFDAYAREVLPRLR